MLRVKHYGKEWMEEDQHKCVKSFTALGRSYIATHDHTIHEQRQRGVPECDAVVQ